MSKNKAKRAPQATGAADGTGAANSTGATDGTREYRLHSHGSRQAADGQQAWDPADDGPAGLGALNASVFQGLQQQAFYPGMAFSGEVFRTGKDGRPRLEDDVVKNEVKTREEFPYG